MTVIPDVMAAAVLRGKGRLAVEDVPVPAVGEHDVLVEVSHCGVCGSDLHLVLDGWGAKGSVGGHEWSGTVVATGAAVTEWAVGDTVVGGPAPRCGQCRECRAGRPSLCTERDNPNAGGEEERGAFALYVKVDQRALRRIPDGLSLRDAALTEPLAVALHGITNAAVQPGERVLVTGAGPIGALTVAALVAMGVDDITVSEPAAVRQALARKLGATRVVTPEELDNPGLFDPGRIVADAVDVVLECSGVGAAMEVGLAQLRRTGRLVLVGAGMAQPQFDPNRILLNELSITGAFCYDFNGFDRALALLASGAVPAAVLLEADDIPLTGALIAMEDLAGGRIAAKVLIAPGMIEPPSARTAPGEAEIGRDREGGMIEPPSARTAPGEAEIGRDREGGMIEPPSARTAPGEAEIGRDREGGMIEPPSARTAPGEAEIGRDREGGMIEPPSARTAPGEAEIGRDREGGMVS